MPGLDDYGALLRSGSASVTDYGAQEAQRQLLALKREELQAEALKAHREVAEQDDFQHDLATILTNPTAQGYSALIAKHPKFAQQVKSSWEVLDKSRQTADLQSMSEVYSAAANRKFDLAAALMQRRIDADKAAGQGADPHDQAILDGLNSGDPVQQKGAMGMIGVTLSAVTGPDKFEQTLGQLTKGTTPELRNVSAGDVVIGTDPATGETREVYRSPYIKTAEGGILERDGTGGTRLTPPHPLLSRRPETPAAGSPQMAVASTLAGGGLPAPVVAGFLGNFHVEGGYGGANGDGGTSHGIAQLHSPERIANFERIIGKPVSESTPEEQAKFTLWEMQNPEAAGMTIAQRDRDPRRQDARPSGGADRPVLRALVGRAPAKAHGCSDGLCQRRRTRRSAFRRCSCGLSLARPAQAEGRACGLPLDCEGRSGEDSRRAG
jgi:hypothetical protein